MRRAMQQRGPSVPTLLALAFLLACGDADPVDPGSAAMVTASTEALYLTPGVSIPVTAAAVSYEGGAVDRPTDWSTSDPGVATVDGDGVVTGVAPGTARVVGRVDQARDTVAVTVRARAGALPLMPDVPVVVPDSTWQLRGQELADLAVTVAGVAAGVVVTGDTLATVTLPGPDALGPCLPADVIVTLHRATSITAASVPADAPFFVRIAAGDRQNLDPAVRHGCALDIPEGEYVLAAVVVDRAGALKGGQLVADSVTLDVWSGSPDAAPVAHRGSDVAAPAGQGLDRFGADPYPTGPTTDPHPSRRPGDLLPGPSPARLSTLDVAAQGACATVGEVGDSMLVATGRDAAGRYDWNAAEENEWWHVVETTPNLALLVDSAGARVWETDAYVRSEVGAVMDLYETEWLPVFRELYGDELPDQDGNSRLIMRSAWNSVVGGGGGIGVYRQADCPGEWRPGEDFYVPMDVYSDDPQRAPAYLRGYHRVVAQHEAAHTHDLARRYEHWGSHTYTSQVAAEGIASFSTTYWLLQKSGDPLLGNHERTTAEVELDGVTYEPGGWAIFPDISRTYEWTAWAEANGYPQSLQFITWAAAQAVDSGRPVASVLAALAYDAADRTTYGDIYRQATGADLGDAEVLVRWGLSWLADDRLDTVGPELTIPTWNTPAIYALEPTPFPLPHGALDAPGRISFRLGEPDIRLLRFTADGSDRFGVAMIDRGAGARLHVQVLRTR